MIPAQALWNNRSRKVAGPWQQRSHPTGDYRGIWYRLDLHGNEVAWLEAPPVVGFEGVTYSIPVKAPQGMDLWPTLVADKVAHDTRLKAKGYELLDEPSLLRYPTYAEVQVHLKAGNRSSKEVQEDIYRGMIRNFRVFAALRAYEKGEDEIRAMFGSEPPMLELQRELELVRQREAVEKQIQAKQGGAT